MLTCQMHDQVEGVHAGADDCSDTAVGHDRLPGALQ